MLSPHKDFLFISTRKCATCTFYRLLAQRGWQKIDEGLGALPEHPLPAKRMADIHITICRNPYDRALSIWGWTNGKRRISYSFDEMLSNYLLDIESREFENEWDACMYEPCSTYHDRFMHDHVIHMENAAEEFAALTRVHLPFSGSVTRPSKHPPSSELTPWQKSAIRVWAAEDFERYGYPL